MAQAFVPELLGRSDYAIIGDIIEANTCVLDLGCGEGELLAWLAEKKHVDARGVEAYIPILPPRQAAERSTRLFPGYLFARVSEFSDLIRKRLGDQSGGVDKHTTAGRSGDSHQRALLPDGRSFDRRH